MFTRGLLVLVVVPALAWAEGRVELHGPPVQVEQAFHDHLPAAMEAGFVREIEGNIQRLGLQRVGQEKSASALILPLRPAPPYALEDRHGVSNFVDHNAAFPNFVRDYQCGDRTYDTAAGYNHRGTDFFTWPFAWQAMAQNAMQVRAAAGGTIVHRVDGNFDRNCSFDVADTPNAVFIQHADGTVGWYLHMKRGSIIAKQVGDSVQAGEVLGEIGSSGISTGPHLHFELRSATHQTIDPYNGQCNTVASRWAQQPDYRDSRLLAVAPHHTPLAFAPSCGEVEQPGYRDRFAPGDRVYATAYFRDLRRGDALRVEYLRPDGSVYAQGDMDTSGMSSEYFSSAYWFSSVVLNDGVPLGMWRARYTYKGRTVETRFAVGTPGIRPSGAWYDPAQSGQGLVVEQVDVGQAQPLIAVSFYAYRNGQPVWMVGNAPLQGNSVTVPLLIGSGASFPPDFNPQDASLQPWGNLSLQFTGPSTLNASWTSSLPGFSDGSLAMSRLSSLADINTDGFDSGMRACLSGSWYNPAQSGHGLQVQIVGGASNRLAAVIWYVYRDGQPYWLNGAAAIPVNGQLVVPMEDGSGGNFPPDFNPAQVQRQPWGEIRLRATGPSSAILEWQTQREGFAPTGTIALTRLTQTLDARCR